MKTVFALVALAFSSAVPAVCYLIYTPANELVWRNNTAPVTLEKLSLDAEVQKMVPKGHLVIVDTVGAPCIKVDLVTPTTARPDAAKTKFD